MSDHCRCCLQKFIKPMEQAFIRQIIALYLHEIFIGYVWLERGRATREVSSPCMDAISADQQFPNLTRESLRRRPPLSASVLLLNRA